MASHQNIEHVLLLVKANYTIWSPNTLIDFEKHKVELKTEAATILIITYCTHFK